MSDSKKPTVSEIRARSQEIQERFKRASRTGLSSSNSILLLDIPHLLDLVSKVGKALGWSLEEIENATLMDDAHTMPHHDCEYISNPESGKCDFHDGYSKARALLEEVKK